jgi:hypothetical protein
MKTSSEFIAAALQHNMDINAPHMPGANRYAEGLKVKRAELDELYIKLYAIVNSGQHEPLNNFMYDLIDRAENLSRDLDKLIAELGKAE